MFSYRGEIASVGKLGHAMTEMAYAGKDQLLGRKSVKGTKKERQTK